jgi:hypothetical protein
MISMLHPPTLTNVFFKLRNHFVLTPHRLDPIFTLAYCLNDLKLMFSWISFGPNEVQS